jgi:molecular chaperone GrpE
VDRRKTQPEDESLEVGGLADEVAGDVESASSAPFRQTVFKPPLREDAASPDQAEASGPHRTGQVVDDDVSSSVDAGFASSSGASSSSVVEGEVVGEVVEEAGEENRDYLQDLLRVQAEFDNFRKRTFRERQSAEARGKRRMVEQLLPDLDNFERAIAHGEGGAGVELVFKDLKSALEREGVAEIPARGQPFDPQVHEAVESIEDDSVDHALVHAVYRPGYTFEGDVVRPAMVVVARPPDESSDDEVAEGGA